MKKSLLLFLFLFISFIQAQPSNEKINTFVERFVELNQFTGSVLVAENDEIILSKGYGFANQEWEIPNSPDTKFRIGSVTKQFTSMLIFQLLEDGKLSLDDKLSDHLDYYRKDTGEKITILQLLNHSSGIPSYTNADNFFQKTGKIKADPKEFILEYCSGDLDFEPGSQFVYNNSAYFILGAVIEEITGMTYEQALIKMILEPLEMSSTGYDYHLKIIAKRADGYRKTYIFPQNDDFVDMSTPYAAGALYSTTGDLFKWHKGLLSNKLITEETKKLMLTPVKNNYANGWFVQKMKFENGDSVTTYSHSGGINGFNSLIYRVPEKNQVVIALANMIPSSVNAIVRGSLEILNGDKVDFPQTSLASLFAKKVKDDPQFEIYNFYQKLKNSEDFNNFPSVERENNSLGYELLNNNLFDAAIDVFKINTELYPESFNVYDSMGEALAKADKKDEAVKYYQKALEINPNLITSIEALKKLGVDIKVPEKIKLTNEEIKLISGKYELSPSFFISIYYEEEKIMAKASGQPSIEITPTSATNFYNNQIPIQIEFNKNDEGNIESLTLFQNGQKYPGKKVE